MILKEQTPNMLLQVRGRIYELLGHCITADVIIKRLNKELLCSVDEQLKIEVTKWAAFYEHRLHKGQKEIFHIEAYIAKFMALYQRFLLASIYA